MMRKPFWILAAILAVASAYAVETKTWTQSESAEFDKGTLKGLALSSDGRVSLAPQWKELYDAAVPHLWCATADGKGAVYAAGAEGKVFSIDAAGQSRTLAKLDGGVVYAITAGKNGDVYAAVSPEAKIYRIEASGKATLYASPKAQYIWALVWGTDGALYAATGDPGQIHRITADGKSEVFFDAEETHVRSLASDGKGGWVAGSEPGGVVLRVSSHGEGFVLYQTPKREVTAVVVAADGAVYAAASGSRGTAAPAPAAPAPAAPAVAAPVNAPAAPNAQAQTVRPVVVPVPSTLGVTPAAAGSDIYRIEPDGEPHRVWTQAAATVYALAIGKDGKVVAGTGNQGRIFRLDSDFASTRLVAAESQQVTALLATAQGGLIAVTANPGKVFQLGPSLERSGTFESDALDAGGFTYWGRLRYEGELNGGAIGLEARSGNQERTHKHWSPWSAVDSSRGSRVAAPAARYLGWRATLSAAADGRSPVLRLVEAAYQAKNLAPVIERVEVTPANYKFAASSTSLSASSSLTLPPIGQVRRTTARSGSASDSAVTMTYDKGSIGARWKSSDGNGDTLKYGIEIRGVEEKQWKPLKSDLKDSRYSWDSTSFADGRYRLRVSASDAEDNFPGQGLQASQESDEFTIDNTPPRIEALSARLEGGKLLLKFKALDALTALASAEYSINGGEWTAVPPTTRMTDSLEHDYQATLDKPAQSEITVAVRVSDENDNVAVAKVVLK